MKLKLITASALVLVAGLTSAHAQTSVAVGDVLIGFRDDNTIAQNSNNLEVNLGSVTQLTASVGSIVDFSSKLTLADLNAAFSSSKTADGSAVIGWSGNDLIRFGTVASGSKVAAVAGSVKGTLWEGAARVDVLTQSTPLLRHSAATQGTALTQIAGYLTGSVASFNGATATANYAQATIVNGTQAGSYNQQGNVGAYFLTTDVNVGDAEKSATASLGTNNWALQDFYLMTPGSGNGTYLGTFGLALASTTTANGQAYTAGNLVFEAGGADVFAIPEPSTYAAILGGLTLGFVALRRRFSKAV